MKQIILIFSILLCQLLSLGQNIKLSGKILVENNMPASFASVSIANKAYGLVADANGSFNMEIADKMLADTLVFSTLGYVSQKYSIQSLADKKNITIQLLPSTVLLKEVIIAQKKYKEIRIGTKKRPFFSSCGVSLANGMLSACMFTPPASPGFLKSVSAGIDERTEKDYLFRIRICKVGKDGNPGEQINNDDIIVKASKKSSWLITDLTKYNIFIDQPYYVVYEWLVPFEVEEGSHSKYRDLFFLSCTSDGSGKCKFKLTSKSQWQAEDPTYQFVINSTILY